MRLCALNGVLPLGNVRWDARRWGINTQHVRQPLTVSRAKRALSKLRNAYKPLLLTISLRELDKEANIKTLGDQALRVSFGPAEP